MLTDTTISSGSFVEYNKWFRGLHGLHALRMGKERARFHGVRAFGQNTERMFASVFLDIKSAGRAWPLISRTNVDVRASLGVVKAVECN